MPDAGSVSVFGFPAASPEARIALGWVPQELAIYPRLTARENLYAFGRYSGLKGAKLHESIAWCLKWAALEDRANELGAQALRRHEAPAQHGRRPHPSAAPCPHGRAHRWRRSPVAQPHLRDDRGAARRGHHHYLHHPLHGRGGAALRPRRHHRPRPHHRARHARGPGARRLRHRAARCRALRRRRRRPSPHGSRERRDRAAIATRLRPLSVHHRAARPRDRGAARVRRHRRPRVVDLSLRRPNLESVFLHLTGRELRD